MTTIRSLARRVVEAKAKGEVSPAPWVGPIPQFLDPRLPMRFWDKCIPEPMSGCWLWFGCNDRGYGKTWDNGRHLKAHRFAYETLVGAVSDDLQLDHLCRTPQCVNPTHLEPVTHRENQIRGIGFVGVGAAATACPHGHAYTPDNILWNHGRRTCRECNYIRSRRRRANMTEAQRDERNRKRRAQAEAARCIATHDAQQAEQGRKA